MSSTSRGNCLFLGTAEDKEYMSPLKGMFGGRNTFVSLEKIDLLTKLEMYCRRPDRNITSVVSTQPDLLKLLVTKQGAELGRKSPSLDNYQGSVFEHAGIEIVFISPLKQLFTVPYGKFIASRFISKVVDPKAWPEPSQFSWEILTPKNFSHYLTEFSEALAIAEDIETFRQNLAIRCVGFSSIHLDSLGRISTRSVVLPLTDDWSLYALRKINALPVPKIFQNGKYDNSYLLRYNAFPEAWFWDTAHLFHSWYSELPKDLAFLNAFFLRRVVYWKDLAETNDLHEYYKYNALDTWATANVWIQQILQLPDWARRNYALEFPLVYPCLLAEMTGLKRDPHNFEIARNEVVKQEDEAYRSLTKMLGQSSFNPGSPKQVVQLLKVLGCADLTSSGEKELKKAILRHPLNGRILEKILDIRGLRKLRTTYLRTDEDKKNDSDDTGGAKEYKGRILYAINPHGTETGRCASREHHFWCGLQIQNIPRGEPGDLSWTKTTLGAEDGFYLGECDLEQAESRDTAHIAGDEKLISAVTGDKDFHSVNASAFFGVPYEDIYDDALGKTKDKKLRDLAKRVNHGANYNMGPDVLVDTMGLDKIWEARRLLKLTVSEPREIGYSLLSGFHRTYPKIKGGMDKPYYDGTFYAWVVQEITVHSRLTSRAFHHTEYNLTHYTPEQYISQGDWTRYCFGDPTKSKPVLNSYVAHPPQSLNARTLNEAFMRVFYDVALPNPTTFRLHAQIHDSILFSYKEGYESHAERVKECMEIPVTVRDVSGTLRTFTVPAALKLGKMKDGVLQRAKFWSETE